MIGVGTSKRPSFLFKLFLRQVPPTQVDSCSYDLSRKFTAESCQEMEEVNALTMDDGLTVGTHHWNEVVISRGLPSHPRRPTRHPASRSACAPATCAWCR